MLTAFVIESYQLLQPDSANTTNQLLSQISAQLSSFTVTPSFVNATFSLPSTIPESAGFRPSSTDVNINLLWFLSLTLSLVTAFFTIAAQQWLRSLSLPRQLSVSNAVRLQQCHRRNMSFYQISNIITLLPVLLQIAVVLFLIGLYFFLNNLNERITIVYSAVALFPFVLYAISLFLPLLWPECPFKSPFVPSTAFVLKLIKFSLYVLAMVLFIVPGMLLVRLFTALLVRYGGTTGTVAGQPRARTHWQHVRWKLFANASRFGLHLRNLYASLFKQSGDFWPNLELGHLRRTREKESPRDKADALSAAPSFVPRTELRKLRACYLSLPSAHRIRCALNWLAMHLGYSGEEDISESGNWVLINEKFVSKVNEYLDTSLQDLLLQSLPHDLADSKSERDWVQEVPDITRVFIMLNQLVKLHNFELRRTFVPMLLNACEKQSLEVDAFWENEGVRGMNLPTVCLFQCSLEHTDETRVFEFDSSRTCLCLCIEAKLIFWWQKHAGSSAWQPAALRTSSVSSASSSLNSPL